MRAAELRALVDRIGSGCVRVCLDPVNNFGIGEDQQRVLDTLGPVIGCLHLKDFRIDRADDRLGFVLRGAPTGEGLLDVAGLVARATLAAAEAPIAQESLSAVIELWTPWQGTIEASVALERTWAEQSVANMRRVLPPPRRLKGPGSPVLCASSRSLLRLRGRPPEDRGLRDARS